MARPRRRRRREERDPWTNDPRDPLETLARLVGRSASPPGMGRGGVPMMDSDITTALGYMPDKLGAALAMSVAGRHASLLGFIATRAYKILFKSAARARDVPVNLHEPADRHRLRLVIRDAIEAIVWPERRQTMEQAAKATRMRKGAYCALFRHVDSELQAVLSSARADFTLRMWADEIERRLRELVPDGSSAVGIVLLRTDVEPWLPITFRTAETLEDLITAMEQEAPFWPQAADIAAALPDLRPLNPRKRRSVEIAGGLLVVGMAW